MQINWKKAILHSGITLGVFLAGVLAIGIPLFGYSNNLKAELERTQRENAAFRDELSRVKSESAELTKELSSANQNIGRLEVRVGELSDSNRRATDRYNELKSAIGGIIGQIEEVGDGLSSFGEELQELIRFISGLPKEG